LPTVKGDRTVEPLAQFNRKGKCLKVILRA
jgi:hypothetical protein